MAASSQPGLEIALYTLLPNTDPMLRLKAIRLHLSTSHLIHNLGNHNSRWVHKTILQDEGAGSGRHNGKASKQIMWHLFIPGVLNHVAREAFNAAHRRDLFITRLTCGGVMGIRLLVR